jgi:sulfoxide reductase heme-binding subunit YedZ
MSVDALWYLSRGSGLVTLVLLTVVVVLGIGTRNGRPAFGLPQFGVAALHRNASLLSIAFLGVHVVTLLFDPYAQLRLVDLLIPFQGAYRPLWVGFGTLASDLLLALVATSLLRQRLGLRRWRLVHWLAYAAWPVALLHALGAGTDATTAWLRAIALLCGGAALAALAWRWAAPVAAPTRVDGPR